MTMRSGFLALLVAGGLACQDPPVESEVVLMASGHTLHQDCERRMCASGQACVLWHPDDGRELAYTCEIQCGEHGPLCPHGMDCKESGDARGHICVRNGDAPSIESTVEEERESFFTTSDARRFLAHLRGIRTSEAERQAMLLAHVCGSFEGCGGDCGEDLRGCSALETCHVRLTESCPESYTPLDSSGFGPWLTAQLDALIMRMLPLLLPDQQRELRRQAERLGLLAAPNAGDVPNSFGESDSIEVGNP